MDGESQVRHAIAAGLCAAELQELIRRRAEEIYDGLEEACDGCKDYNHVLGNVVIKNA